MRELRERSLPLKKFTSRVWQAVDHVPESILFASHTCSRAEILTFESIKEAAQKLKQWRGLWVHYPDQYVRRGELIQNHLLVVQKKIRRYQDPIPSGPLHFYSLLTKNKMALFFDVSPPLVPQKLLFPTNQAPPSRAYLKLSEIFYRIQTFPKSGSRILELGCSPGGWTWFLSCQLNCQVTAVDTANIDPMISKMKNVTFIKKDGFLFLKNISLESFHWLISDMATPIPKMIDLVKFVTQQKLCPNLIIVFKCSQSQSIPWANLLSLLKQHQPSQFFVSSQNKHELYWVFLPSRPVSG